MARVPLFALDLGKLADYSALVGGYFETRPDDCNEYHILFIHRWQKGTPYIQVKEEAIRFVTNPKIDQDAVSLALDYSGPGISIGEEMVRGLSIPVHLLQITGGHNWRKDEANGHYNVSKTLLVSCIGALFSSGRIHISEKMRETETLLKELKNFQVKISKALNEVYDTREGSHDDLVLATALLCWAGENLCLGPWDATPNPDARSLVDRLPGGVFLDGPMEDGGSGAW